MSAITPLVVPLAIDPAVSGAGDRDCHLHRIVRRRCQPAVNQRRTPDGQRHPRDEAFFFRALLIYAIAMIAIVPLLVWLVFMSSGIF